MAQAAADLFEHPYMFGKSGVTVVLQHALDKNIRVDGDGDIDVNANGGFGGLARWTVELDAGNDGIMVKFKSEKSGKYLRITKDGDKVNAGGNGGKLTEFKVHRMSSSVCKLESIATPGAYIAVDKDGVRVGKGGKWCRIEILREGKAPAFSKRYHFKNVKKVILEHRDHKTLRVNPKDLENVNSEGGKGEFAQWEATPSEGGDVCQFKSVKTGDYLRIRPNGDVDAGGKGKGLTFFKIQQVGAVNEVRLESQKHDGKFIELDPQNNTFVSGDGKNRKSIFHVFRDD